MKPNDQSVQRNMLLNYDDLLDHFSLVLCETKAIENETTQRRKLTW